MGSSVFLFDSLPCTTQCLMEVVLTLPMPFASDRVRLLRLEFSILDSANGLATRPGRALPRRSLPERRYMCNIHYQKYLKNLLLSRACIDKVRRKNHHLGGMSPDSTEGGHDHSGSLIARFPCEIPRGINTFSEFRRTPSYFMHNPTVKLRGGD